MVEGTTKVERPGFIRRRVVEPMVQLLRIGMTPRRLAWSIAIGVVIGINPLLGSTTVLVLAVASAFRLNLVASQLGNHLVYPLELLLFPVFLRVGIALFHSPGLPLEREALFHAVKRHPWDTTRLLWRWEWHALIVWLGFAVIVAPLLQLALRPVLERMLVKLHDEPVLEK
ncbi:MAG TPA: DUF2062 domain-containing protein [Granulicella sp.]|jgi:hypothetical protein